MSADPRDESATEPGRFGVFAHLTTQHVDLYRRIMAVFVTAKERFQVHLRPEDVYSDLLTDGGEIIEMDDVANKLDSLESWGNLRSDPDTSRVTAVEDFYRRRLLYQVTQPGEAAAGTSVRYHGDFDWGGVTIANTLSSHIVWTPWRFTAADYLDALDARESTQALPPLTETPVETAWDPELQKAMTEHGVGIEEELVLDTLLSDLSATRSR